MTKMLKTVKITVIPIQAYEFMVVENNFLFQLEVGVKWIARLVLLHAIVNVIIVKLVIIGEVLIECLGWLELMVTLDWVGGHI